MKLLEREKKIKLKKKIISHVGLDGRRSSAFVFSSGIHSLCSSGIVGGTSSLLLALKSYLTAERVEREAGEEISPLFTLSSLTFSSLNFVDLFVGDFFRMGEEERRGITPGIGARYGEPSIVDFGSVVNLEEEDLEEVEEGDLEEVDLEEDLGDLDRAIFTLLGGLSRIF